MKCPYCGQELAKGTFYSRGGNYFLPDGEKTPALYTQKAMDKANAVQFGPGIFALEPDWPAAFCCKECRKIIIPY